MNVRPPGQPAPSGGWIRRLWPFLVPHRRNVALAFGAAVAGMAVNALVPVIQKVIVDDVALRHRRPLLPWLALLVAAAAFSFGAAHVRRYLAGRVSLDVPNDLRNAIFERLHRLDFARHDQLQTGELVSRASSDVELLHGLLAFLPLVTGNLVMLVVSLGIMLVLSPVLTLVALSAIPLILVTSLRLRTSVFPASWDSQQRTANVAAVVEEAVTGVRVVKGFGQERRELGRLAAAARRLYASRVRSIRLQARLQSTLQAIPGVAQAAALALGGWLAVRGQLTLGTFLAFSSYLLQLTSPVRMFAGLVSFGQQARAGGERILEVLDSNPLVTERLDAVDLGPVQGDVEFDDVTFGYLRAEPVLRGFSLHIRPGETVALVGGSGSGKSTVALLLPRFYDVQNGAVRVDGVDVRDVTFASLRRQVGVVFEESFLFSDTVRANITFGQPDATDEQVMAAARAAEAHQFISALPEGYDTLVGERGLTLSGGQRQRIALARALLADPRVLVLDDATSSVDSNTEEEIHATLRRLMRGRTTLVVAHRRSTLALADRIVVVDGGRVVDSGTAAELTARCPLFRLLLAGPGEGCEGDGQAGLVGPGPTASGEGRQAPDGEAPAPSPSLRPAAHQPTIGLGVGLGHGGGGHGRGVTGHMAAFLAPTPELLAAVEALPPADDDPAVDDRQESRPDGPFRLGRFLRPFRRPLAVGLLLVATQTVLTLAGPWLVRRGIDQGMVRAAAGGVWSSSLLLLAVSGADWVVSWLLASHTGRTAERLLFALRIRIFAHLQRLSLDYYEREPAGRIMTRMTTDIHAFSTLLQTGLINALVNLLSFLGVAVVMVVINPRLALATFAVMPPLAAATWWFRRRAASAYGRARDRVAAVNANLQESLAGVRLAQAYVREDRAIAGFRRATEQYLDARLSAQRLVATYFPFVQFLSGVAAAIVLGVGTGMVTRGSLTVGELIAFLLYVNLLFSPLQELSQVFDNWQQARASLNKIVELMEIPTSTPEPARPVVPGRLAGAIRFEGVRLRYPGGLEDALSGVDLDISPGETVALVGETGAGKSTIVKLVARFYDPTEGRILVDGIPLTDLDLAAYRAQLGYVPQEPFLFAGTIADNVAYGRPDASLEEIEAAARAVGAHDFIARLPEGYHHPVSERGRSLSGGQRQLVALARALLVDPAILLLDEATSNLDLSSEARVNRAMGVVSRGRTTLLIAHRLPTARRADRILVVHDGRVVEEGSHEDLLALGGRYARMWRAFEPEREAV